MPFYLRPSQAEQQSLRQPVTPHKYQWSWEDSVSRNRQIYGDRADSIRTAEIFEQSDYSFKLPQEQFARLFLP